MGLWSVKYTAAACRLVFIAMGLWIVGLIKMAVPSEVRHWGYLVPGGLMKRKGKS